jgi:hypothetical protein
MVLFSAFLESQCNKNYVLLQTSVAMDVGSAMLNGLGVADTSQVCTTAMLIQNYKLQDGKAANGIIFMSS